MVLTVYISVREQMHSIQEDNDAVIAQAKRWNCPFADPSAYHCRDECR